MTTSAYLYPGRFSVASPHAGRLLLLVSPHFFIRTNLIPMRGGDQEARDPLFCEACDLPASAAALMSWRRLAHRGRRDLACRRALLPLLALKCPAFTVEGAPSEPPPSQSFPVLFMPTGQGQYASLPPASASPSMAAVAGEISLLLTFLTFDISCCC
jgi:hypothetical protein